MKSPIVLLTDFGHTDPYVGQMKGVLATHAPDVPVIDLCHGVRPQAVAQAAMFLSASFTYFPEGSVFVCVVDPGVGTDRDILCLHAAGRYVLAPDNGLISPLLSEYPSSVCYRVDISEFDDASQTFHGRDIFCPLAARIALGADADILGTVISHAHVAMPRCAVPVANGEYVDCSVLHIDTFGNVVLNLNVVPWRERLAAWEDLYLKQTPPIRVMRANSFGTLPPNTLGCIEGSQGFLELVLNGASAAQMLKVSMDDIITLQGYPIG